jgi:hypothetical protein
MSDIITERSGNILQLEGAVKLENEEFSERVRSAEAKEAFTAFLEKRRPILAPPRSPRLAPLNRRIF